MGAGDEAIRPLTEYDLIDLLFSSYLTYTFVD